MSLLEDILKEKRSWIAAKHRELSRPSGVDFRDTVATLRRPLSKPLRLNAEIKFRSPSAGELSKAMGTGERALCYERSGASMVSVLTDNRFFGGNFSELLYAHHATRTPVLCKDFIIDDAQVAHANGYGADAVLLIARCLPGRELRSLATAVRKRRMEPFIEVSTEAELARALEVNPQIVGVNARDLDSLEMDPERAARVLDKIPKGIVAVHLSGLKTPEDVMRVSRTRADAALIGEILMRQDDPMSLLKSLVAAANG